MTVFYFKYLVEPKAEVTFEYEADGDGTDISYCLFKKLFTL